MATRLKESGYQVVAGWDSLVVEQLMDNLPTDLHIWMCERKPTTGEEAGAIAHWLDEGDMVKAQRQTQE